MAAKKSGGAEDDRLAKLREDVRSECRHRFEKRFQWPAGHPRAHLPAWTEADRAALDYREARAAYARSRAIETKARGCWRNLARVMREAEAFASGYEEGSGALIAESLVGAVPALRAAIEAAPNEAFVTGAAGFSDKPPSRVTFVHERLRPYAAHLGLAAPEDIDVQTLAVLSLLSEAFWPYADAAMKRFARDGYPSVSEVIAREAEELRKRLPKASPKTPL